MGQTVRLINNKASIFCTFNLREQSTLAYTTTMQIKLWYSYMQSDVKRIAFEDISASSDCLYV